MFWKVYDKMVYANFMKEQSDLGLYCLPSHQVFNEKQYKKQNAGKNIYEIKC